MKLPTFQFMAQMSAALAVTASLALVAYELKLSRDLGMAALAQVTAEGERQSAADMMNNERLAGAYMALYVHKSQLTPEQMQLIMWDQDANMATYQALFVQEKLGLLDDAHWDAVQREIAAAATLACYANRRRKGVGFEWRPDFIAEVKDLWAGVPEVECPIKYFRFEDQAFLW